MCSVAAVVEMDEVRPGLPTAAVDLLDAACLGSNGGKHVDDGQVLRSRAGESNPAELVEVERATAAVTVVSGGCAGADEGARVVTCRTRRSS